MSVPGVKICGVTRAEDAHLAVELGADFIGLNFWPRSPRFVTAATAEEIATAVAGRALLVGVWVDPSREEVAARAKSLSLDLFQFHGAENSLAVGWFPERVIQAIRVNPDLESASLDKYARAWGFLFDCAPPGIYGGTGESWSYERIAGLETSKPVILAGGLDPENVAVAIARSGVNLVDVCSGVEASPGIKDPDLLARFFKEVRNVQTPD